MFSDVNILVVGDVMLDHYIWGDATRISPEAPVPVVGVERDTYVPGGAANVAANLAGLGVGTRLLGRFGPDEGGERLGLLLSERSIRLLPLGCANDVSTIVKMRVVVRCQQMCRIDRELAPAAYRLTDRLDPGALDELLDGIDAVVISDYAKGVVDDALLELLRKRRDHSALDDGATPADDRPSPFLALDPKPKRRLDLSGMDLLTPNRAEALQLAGLASEPGSPFDDAEVCGRIHQAYAPRNLVVTLGPEGMLLCREGRVLGRLPTQAKEVFDVSGAGDTVVATLAAALASGRTLEDAADLANRAAGIVVSHIGTSPISAKELEAASGR